MNKLAQVFRSGPSLVAVFAGLIAPVAISLALVPVRQSFNSTDDALVLVIVVVGVSTIGNRLAGVIGALSSSTWFDFFFTRPYEHFSITKRADIETTLLLLVVGVVATELAARGERQRQIAREGANYLEMIHDFSELTATGEPAEFVIIRAAAELTDLLYLRDCRFEQTQADRSCPRLEPGGEVIVSGKRWLASDIGLPSPEVELLVESHGQLRGRFVLVPTPGQPVTLERRVVAVALAGQVWDPLESTCRHASLSIL